MGQFTWIFVSGDNKIAKLREIKCANKIRNFVQSDPVELVQYLRRGDVYVICRVAYVKPMQMNLIKITMRCANSIFATQFSSAFPPKIFKTFSNRFHRFCLFPDTSPSSFNLVTSAATIHTVWTPTRPVRHVNDLRRASVCCTIESINFWIDST